MYCKKCGAKINDNASFCSKCGAQLKGGKQGAGFMEGKITT